MRCAARDDCVQCINGSTIGQFCLHIRGPEDTLSAECWCALLRKGVCHAVAPRTCPLLRDGAKATQRRCYGDCASAMYSRGVRFDTQEKRRRSKVCRMHSSRRRRRRHAQQDPQSRDAERSLEQQHIRAYCIRQPTAVHIVADQPGDCALR